MVDTDESGGRGKLAVLADGAEEGHNHNDSDTLSPAKVRSCCVVCCAFCQKLASMTC